VLIFPPNVNWSLLDFPRFVLSLAQMRSLALIFLAFATLAAVAADPADEPTAAPFRRELPASLSFVPQQWQPAEQAREEREKRTPNWHFEKTIGTNTTQFSHMRSGGAAGMLECYIPSFNRQETYFPKVP
jgi:hypothetical protein